MERSELMKNKEKPKKKGLWWKVLLTIVVCVGLAGGGYAWVVYQSAKQTVEKKIHTPVASIDTSIGKKKMKQEKPLNILLMGVDEREDDQGRSDALMVLSMKPGKDQMNLVSIPRDTRTTIAGDGRVTKINHAYAYGGTEMSINTVEDFLDIDLDYYVKLNMEGLSELVDAVGGIEVTNHLEWTDTGHYKKGYTYEKGNIHLNGPQTMGFVRMRYQDPNNDFGRNERQRTVIQALIDKGASFSSVNKIGSILDVLGDNMQTNLAFEDMRHLFLNYRSVRNNVVTYQMTGEGKMIDGLWYLLVPEQEVQKVHNMLKISD
ncbi:transcriptional regulator LytR [Pontibacillus yanchengensis]|uniref:Transcriptional regulator LytR n=1 Tax=Pontibacillus yanchengensis TaxID=462910 RepID=A0A6I5A1P7_9BACI|nr:LCP family protein [Pontibacillus yanchengensis]MYL34372.1 transcriptional regulator LytR [Pontibacillus yanchengensis]